MFETAAKSINFARICIEMARIEAQAYLRNHAFAHVIEKDSETGELVAKIKLISPPPDELEGHFRTAILETKHSFDMILNAAARAFRYYQFKRNFPWADTRTGVEEILKRRQDKDDGRLPKALIDEILRHEPFATGKIPTEGNVLIRDIAKMANNKHSVGITAKAAITSFGLNIDHLIPNNGAVTFFSGWNPKKKELEFIRLSGDAYGSFDKPKIAGDIFFDRAGPIGEIPAHIVATMFLEKAEVALGGFKALCSNQ